MPLRWAATATVAGSITFALDHYRVGLLAHGRAQLSGLQSLTLWTGHLLLAMAVVVLGLLGTGAALLASRGETRGGAWWLAPRVRALAISSVVILVPLVGPLAWAGATLASGPWISEQSFAAAIHWAPVVGGLIVVPAALWFATLQPSSTRGVNRLIGLAALAVATLAGIDHLSSPGQFPEFHLLLQGLGTIAAVLAASHTLGRWWQPGTRWTRIVSLVCGTACVAAPAVWFGMSPNTRSALVLRSPVARDWLATVLPAWPPTLLHEVLATLDVGAGRYTVEQRDTYDGIDEMEVDRLVLDLPEPWRVVPHASRVLRGGGILAAYCPSIVQVMQLRDALAVHGFMFSETIEVLNRSWHVEGAAVRPDHRMVAHTGFLTTARLIAAV